MVKSKRRRKPRGNYLYDELNYYKVISLTFSFLEKEKKKRTLIKIYWTETRVTNKEDDLRRQFLETNK